MCEFCSILLQSDVIVTFKYRFWDQSANFSPYQDITNIQNWQFQGLISAFFTPLPPYRKIVTLKCGNPQDCSKLPIIKKIKANFYCLGLENQNFFPHPCLNNTKMDMNLWKSASRKMLRNCRFAEFGLSYSESAYASSRVIHCYFLHNFPNL